MRLRRRGRAILSGTCVLMLGACGGTSPFDVTLDLDVSEFQTAISVVNFGERLSAKAEPIDGAFGPIAIEPEGDEADAIVGVMFYESSLDDLDVTPGGFFPSGNDGYFTPDAAFVSGEVSEEQSAAWSDLDTRGLREFMELFRVPGNCDGLSIKPVNVPVLDGGAREGSEVTGAVEIDEMSALVATLDGRYFRVVKRSNTATPVLKELEVTGTTNAFIGGFRSKSFVWFGGDGGVLASIPVEEARDSDTPVLRARVSLPTLPGQESQLIVRIDGDPETDDDIFALTIDGSVLHYDGTELERIGAIPGTSTRSVSIIDVREIRWVGPKRAIAISPVRDGLDPIYEFEVGKEPRAMPPPGDVSGLEASALAFGHQGLFVSQITQDEDNGNYVSDVWLWSDVTERWVLYARPDFAVLGVVPNKYDVALFGAVPRGFFFEGLVARQLEGYDYAVEDGVAGCEPYQTASVIRSSVRLGDGALLIGSARWGSDTNQLLWIR